MQSREEMSNETMETGNGSDRKFCTGGGNAASDECTGKRAGVPTPIMNTLILPRNG